jgi:hypothetical protein
MTLLVKRGVKEDVARKGGLDAEEGVVGWVGDSNGCSNLP